MDVDDVEVDEGRDVPAVDGGNNPDGASVVTDADSAETEESEKGGNCDSPCDAEDTSGTRLTGGGIDKDDVSDTDFATASTKVV